MKSKWISARATVLALASLAGWIGPAFLQTGCASFPGFTTPPIDTPKQTSTFTLGDLWPGAPESTIVPVAVPTNLPPYRVKEREGGLTLDVPAQARSLDVTRGVLHLALASQMKIRLGFKFFLAKEDPYSTPPIGEVTIAPGESKQIDMAFDTGLLKNPTLRAGVEAQVLESEPAVVKRSDPLSATIWATIQVKVF